MEEFTYTMADVRRMWDRAYSEQIGIMDAKIMEAMVKTGRGVAISYGGGKDSGMLLDRAAYCWRALYGDKQPLPVIFANTGCEFASMWPFVQRFVQHIMDKHHIVIELRRVSAKQPFSRTVREVGYPFPSKKIARMVGDVRAQMQRLGVGYADIRPLIHGGLPGAQAMREMGFSAVAVCDVTGVKRDDTPGTCVIPRVWAPLLGAPFEVSHLCCQIHKKGPIKALERELGGLVPMTGEMAANSKTRLDAYRRTGCNRLIGDKRVSKPMGPMTEQTVNEYYYRTRLPLAPPYGEPVREGTCERNYTYRFSGEQNTGCKLCGFGIMYDWGRFARLAEIEPETVRWAFKPLEDGGLGYGEVCRYINAECHGRIVLPAV